MKPAKWIPALAIVLLLVHPSLACDLTVTTCVDPEDNEEWTIRESDFTPGDLDKTVCIDGLVECGAGTRFMEVAAQDVTVRCEVGASIVGLGAGANRGIYTNSGGNGVAGLTVRDCTFSNFERAIRLFRVEDALVEGNTIVPTSDEDAIGIQISNPDYITDPDPDLDKYMDANIVVRSNTIHRPGVTEPSGYLGKGVDFRADSGEIDGNTVERMNRGIVVGRHPLPPLTPQDIEVTGNSVSFNSEGIRLEGVYGGDNYTAVVEGNKANDNDGTKGWGIVVADGSERIVIRDNDALRNGNEGIRVSDKIDFSVANCPPGTVNVDGRCCRDFEPNAGGHRLHWNEAALNGEEGIYIVCSDSNEIFGNDMTDNDVRNNGTAGIYVDEHSEFNWIEGNQLLNDTIELRESSDRNVLIDNELTQTGSIVTMKFNGSKNNFVDNATVAPNGSNAPFTFQDHTDTDGGTHFAQCNQIVDSAGLFSAGGDEIEAVGSSTNNRFLRFTQTNDLECSVSPGSSVGVTDVSGADVPCGTPEIDPSLCTYWFATKLCGEGADLEEADSYLALDEQIGVGMEEVRYFRARDGDLKTGNGGVDEFVVGGEGCVHLEATGNVVLGPGTVVKAGGRLSVGF